MKKIPHYSIPHGATSINMDLIEEDKTQPRKEFNQESLKELAKTIKLRGVKSPISVRENPEKPNTYIINHGARRYRASKLAGLKKIPAFIDNDYSEADQVIENLHRDNLSSRELADFIGRQLALGKTKAEIAKSLGKNPAYITMLSALLDLPDIIQEIYNNEKCTDTTAIYSLYKIYKKFPLELSNWLDHFTGEEITRTDILNFKKYLEAQQEEKEDAFVFQESFDSDSVSRQSANNKKSVHKPQAGEPYHYDELDMLYHKILKPQAGIPFKKLKESEKKIITSRLKHFFEKGRKGENDLPYFTQELFDHHNKLKKSRGIELLAFLAGMDKDQEFDIEAIIRLLPNQD